MSDDKIITHWCYSWTQAKERGDCLEALGKFYTVRKEILETSYKVPIIKWRWYGPIPWPRSKTVRKTSYSHVWYVEEGRRDDSTRLEG
jgi:hypothetical protein